VLEAHERIMTRLSFLFAVSLTLSLAACHSGRHDGTGSHVPGDSASTMPYDGIGAGESVHFTGTEPFWGGEATGTVLNYTTPEKPDGQTITVERFAGRNGISFTGKLNGDIFSLAITPGACSDGMSDRDYPFNATLRIGDGVRAGCGWTDKQPFKGEKQP
jgi:uncharacterized membrane protein